ncbi:MAG: TetR/AcrR family transcriptional regulator [Gemmatimonadetes bacterium]|nr:TetR/AcrR family transcriptional regulator [Gemmatimonadota bacterium]
MEAREKILDAAVRVFSEAGSRGATTRRIAEVAGVNEVTLFRQFGCKERLLREALFRVSERPSFGSLPAEPGDAEAELVIWASGHLRELYAASSWIRRSIGEFEENPEVSASSCSGPALVARELRSYLDRLQEQGTIAADADTGAAAAMLMGAILADAIGRDVMPDRYPFSVDEAAERYVRLFFRGISARADLSFRD